MIENLKPYPEYKNSGLPWLGEVPAHWEIKRNGGLFQQRNDQGDVELPILEVSLRTGVRVRDFAASKRKQVMTDRSKYKRAGQGDLVYNMMRMWQGASGIAPVSGLVSPAYVVCRAMPGIDSGYFSRLFKTEDYLAEIDAASRGIVKDRNRLYWDQFKQICSPLPPASEQAAIARFLAWATNRLGRAVGAKRRIIALLQEQKQAIIHRAVTRGLDPSVPLKDSGIPWLGEIPEHWEVISIGAISELLQTGPFGSQLHQSDYINSGIPVINPSHLSDGRIRHSSAVTITSGKAEALSRHRLKTNDILIARRGDLGRCAVATASEEGWICGTGSLLLRCKSNMIKPDFLQIVFSSRGMCQMLELSSIGATMANLNEGSVARQRIPLPTLPEQEGIVASIRTSSETENAAISRLESEITLLREYRIRLIADVVTGKLDVREVAAGLPEEIEPSIQSDAAGVDGDEAEDDLDSDPTDTEED
jgi:type I restriction enzyme S subunit